ncbi:hypothetical protein AB0E63_37795 [Kribbella sp. NPDC026596]|uniref:hypothetical protein n=1 Tax=Kribbella sp. NPDC026596 TaxID=3155122 RepID=UPI0033C076D6
MRLLPDRPSIEYLRKEAKDLLGVLRESNPDASLADAQRALAAEYGERDWPALKAEVERRAAETPTAPDGLAEELAGVFGLGSLSEPARPVSFTPMGRCWAGTTYGTLHALAIPSETPINPYVIWRRPEADWYLLRDRARAAGKPWAEQLDALLPALLDLHGIEADIASAKLILCNQNCIPSHVRLGRHGELVVMEWDFAGSLTAELEVGIALTHWTMRPSINPKAVAAFREGYLDVAEWPKLDLSSFGVAVTAWLNWTYNAICEAIDPDDPNDPERAGFLEREAVGLLDRPMTRAGLEQLLVV